MGLESTLVGRVFSQARSPALRTCSRLQMMAPGPYRNTVSQASVREAPSFARPVPLLP